MKDLQHVAETLDWRILLIVLSLLAVLWVQAPRLMDTFRVDEDFRTFYWMSKFQDPSLFPDYPGNQVEGYSYTILQLPGLDLLLYFRSLGYELLFYIASFFIPPILFSKLLPFILMPISAIYLFNYGKSVRDSDTGVILATGFLFLNLISPTSISVIPGLQRSFACPLIIAELHYLRQKKHIVLVAIVVASALVYAPVFLVSTAAWGLYTFNWEKMSQLKLPIAKNELKFLLTAFLLGGILLSPIVLPKFTGIFESTNLSEHYLDTTNKLVLSNPGYRPGGRYSLFQFFPWIGRGGLVTKGVNATHLIALLLIACSLILIRGPKNIELPREIYCVLIAGVGLFVLSWVALLVTNSLLLYEPSRYPRASLFLFLVIFILLNVREGVEEAVFLIRYNRYGTLWLVGVIEIFIGTFISLYPTDLATYTGINIKWVLAVAGLFLGLLGIVITARKSPRSISSLSESNVTGRILIGIVIGLILICWATYTRLIARGSGLTPSPPERDLLAFLQTLPKDVLLAGTPSALDNVPLFAKRQILFSREQISQDSDLMREALDTYYAEDAQRVVDFCQAHGVDYLVIDPQTYTEEYLDAGWIFFEPYNQVLLPIVRSRETFALAQVPDEAKVFQSEEVFVVPCTRAALR